MKHVIIVNIFLILILNISCGSRVNNEIEPNNESKDATIILGKTFGGSVSPEDSVDWYVLKDKIKGSIQFTISHDEADDFDFEIFSDKIEVASAVGVSSGDSATANINGRCFIKVYHYSGSGTYEMEIEKQGRLEIQEKDKKFIYRGEEQFVIAEKCLKLRDEPNNEESEVITCIPRNERVWVEKAMANPDRIKNKQGHWAFVTWEKYKGWAFDAFLSSKEKLKTVPKNRKEIVDLLTSGTFKQYCDVTFKLNRDGSGTGSFESCNEKQSPIFKNVRWLGKNPFYVEVNIQNDPVAADGIRIYTITYDKTTNGFDIEPTGLSFRQGK